MSRICKGLWNYEIFISYVLHNNLLSFCKWFFLRKSKVEDRCKLLPNQSSFQFGYLGVGCPVWFHQIYVLSYLSQIIVVSSMLMELPIWFVIWDMPGVWNKVMSIYQILMNNRAKPFKISCILFNILSRWIAVWHDELDKLYGIPGD